MASTLRMERTLIMKKILVCLAVSLVMVTGFCFVTQAQAKDPIKLGVVEPLSGNFKDIGDRYLELSST